MADTLDPAELRKAAELTLSLHEMPGVRPDGTFEMRRTCGCATCRAAVGCLGLLDREAAAQQVLATMAPRLERLLERLADTQQALGENFAAPATVGMQVLAETHRDAAYLLSVVDALAGQVAQVQKDRAWLLDRRNEEAALHREVLLGAVQERDAARQQLAEAARLLRCEPDQVLARLEQIAAAQPPDVEEIEARLGSGDRSTYVLAHSQQQALQIAALEQERSTRGDTQEAMHWGHKMRAQRDEAHAAIWGLLCAAGGARRLIAAVHLGVFTAAVGYDLPGSG